MNLGKTISKRVSFPAEFCAQQKPEYDDNSIARADSGIVHGEILMLDHESNNSPPSHMQSLKSLAGTRVNNFQMDRSNTDLLGAFKNNDPNKSLPDSVNSGARNSNYLDE